MSGVSTFLVIVVLTQLLDRQTRKVSGPYLPRNSPAEKRGQGQQIPQKYWETLWYSRSSSLRDGLPNRCGASVLPSLAVAFKPQAKSGIGSPTWARSLLSQSKGQGTFSTDGLAKEEGEL